MYNNYISKVTVESIKKISVYYKEVCNNKLFDCHHSDKDRTYFVHACKKGYKQVKPKTFIVNEDVGL